MDFAEVMAAARPREEVIRLCLAGDLNAEHGRLQGDLAEAQRPSRVDTGSLADMGTAKVTAVAEAIEDVEARMVEHTIPFRLRALGPKDWSDLIAAHPPRPDTDEQTFGERVFNTETYPPALIAACCFDPAMTVDQVRELFEVLNEGQRNALFNGAWRANMGTDVPFSPAASAMLRSSEPK